MAERYTYTVVKGDTLSAIGRKVGVPWQSLFAMNRGVSQAVYDPATDKTVTRTLTNPDLIWPGFVLKLGEAPDPVVVDTNESGDGKSSGLLPLLAAAAFFLMS